MSKNYDKTFKVQTVQMIQEEGKPVSQGRENWASPRTRCIVG